MGPEGKPQRSRSEHGRCTRPPSGVSRPLEIQGSRCGRRKQRDPIRRAGLGELVETFREAKDPREFMESLRLTSFTTKSLLHAEGEVMLPRAPARSTSRMRSTPKSDIERWAPASTGASSSRHALGFRDVVEISPPARTHGLRRTGSRSSDVTARSRIRHWLTAHRREAARERDATSSLRHSARGDRPDRAQPEVWRKLFSDLRTSGEETLYESLGGTTSRGRLRRRSPADLASGGAELCPLNQSPGPAF